MGEITHSDKEAKETDTLKVTEMSYSSPEEIMDENEYLQKCGGWGRYQCFNAFMSWWSIAIISCHIMTMYYVHLPLDVECVAPEGCGETAVPDVDDFCDAEAAFRMIGFDLRGPDSIYEQWNLTCASDKVLVTVSDSSFFLGWLVGGILCGKVSDIHGRRLPLAAFYILSGAAVVCTTFAPSIEIFVILKFFHGIFVGPLLLTNYIYGNEFIPVAKGALFGTMYFMIGAAGSAALSPVAWYIGDWKNLSYFVGMMTAPLAAWPLLSPESPMWLLSVGKTQAAKVVFQKIARWNRVPLPKADVRAAATDANDEVDDRGPMALFQFARIRVITISMVVVWLACSLCYFGLSLSGATLPGDAYLNAALLSLIELPVYPIQLIAVDSVRLGRKKTMILSLLIGSACCFINLLPIGDASRWFAFGGNMFMTAAFTTTYIWAAEVFPADVRASGLGICTGGGKLGSVCTPFIVMLGSDSLTMAMVVFGSVAAVGALFAFWIPETRGVAPLQTLAEFRDLENFMLESVREGDASDVEVDFENKNPIRPGSAPPQQLLASNPRFSCLPLPNGRPASSFGWSSSYLHERNPRHSFGHPFLTGS
eukprot:TRINITY_DN21847_c0_g1_i1.p1 TRINITY_DN21847_c0_g1~~TRINITY_DN21847_c0_g1_i1.p1  ORF type:complete len:618 (+),score=101.92 TRINITY_DN21847_c0_g1_i1:74-1855(+)